MSIQTQQVLAEAVQHHQTGNLAQAQQLYTQVLSVEPNHPGALHQLATLAIQTGNPAVGLEIISRALALRPKEPAFHITRGMALAAIGRLDEAIESYRISLTLQPDSLAGLVNLGNALLLKGDVDEAIILFEKAIAIQPNFPHGYVNLGCAFRDSKRFEEAKQSFEKAIQLQNPFPEAEYLLGATLADLGDFDKAVVAFQKALNLRSGFFEALMGLGSALFRLDRFEESTQAYEKAVALRPEDFVAQNDLACTLMELGRINDGVDAYQRSLEIKDDADSHLHMGMGLLALGDFEQGLAEYESRPQARTTRPGLPVARWDGGKLAGKTILIHEEQGLGDAIQFVRYIPRVARASGAKIVLECATELVRLFASVAGIKKIVPRGSELPPCDAHCPLLSLPYVMKTRLESIPAQVPYLLAESHEVERWRDRLGTDEDIKIGLAWAGSKTHKQDKKRSLAPELLAPLATVPGIRFISLQKDRKDEAAKKLSALSLTDWTDELYDLANTAALMANLDLVITVDTAVAHLAGAMGKEVWVLLSHVPDWRWMMDRTDSPWYPTMRLFRQSADGDWSGVIQRVVKELAP